jgi:hypothetical protein
MVIEKMVAASQAAGMLAQGASTRSVISFYRSRVQENVRRLDAEASLGRKGLGTVERRQASGDRAFGPCVPSRTLRGTHR